MFGVLGPAGRGSGVSLVVRGADIVTEMSAYLVDRPGPR
jgi:hypothetical protein